MAFTSLSDLKKSRGGFENLMKEVEKISKPESGKSEDDRFWQPSVDKVGNGYAVIRFLPPPQSEDLPWARVWSHGFQGPTGKWYIENSLTTLGQADPVSELNTELWNSGVEADKETARKQKRKLTYISNILVIKDPANPENEGQVKLFKYGKKIFDKIKDITDPQFEDEEPINPFDFWKGANFKLKIRNVEGYRNYDKSEFDKPSEIAESDDEIGEIWQKQHSLAAFLDAKNFKSYEELKKKLNFVLNGPQGSSKKAEKVDLDEDVVETKKEAKTTSIPTTKVKREEVDFSDDDDSLSYFAKLAEE
jgi:hypothetical protein